MHVRPIWVSLGRDREALGLQRFACHEFPAGRPGRGAPAQAGGGQRGAVPPRRAGLAGVDEDKERLRDGRNRDRRCLHGPLPLLAQ